MIPLPEQPEPAQIRAQLGRLVASQRFSHSQALTRFLEFTFEETLAGRGDTLKESVLGVEVFTRGGDFDPRIDPIVRVQAAKLRTRLKEYYDEEGGADPVLVDYPKGSYHPVFRFSQAPPVEAAPEPVPALPAVSAPRRSGKWWPVLAAVLVVAASAGLWLLLRPATLQPLGPPARVTSDSGTNTFPAISRNGQLIVYASDRASHGNLDLWAQARGGTEPVRLTTHPATDRTPDVSPDGSQVVFRSDRDGGGIFIVDVLTRQERRLADGGWRPRYSPDGAWVVYQGEDISVIPSTGGTPRKVELGAKLDLVGSAMFTPDATRILFLARRRDEPLDWWVVPREGGAAKPAGVAARLAGQGVSAPFELAGGAWTPAGDLLFSLHRESTANLWCIRLSHRDWTVSGSAWQVTSGTAKEHEPRLSSDGKLVFVSELSMTHLWSLPAGAKAVTAQNSLLQLTTDSSMLPGNFRVAQRFSSAAGLLVYPSVRANNADVWLKDLVAGSERPVAATNDAEDQPLLSPDASWVVWRVRQNNRSALWGSALGHFLPRQITPDCVEPLSWSRDGMFIYCINSQGGLQAVHRDSGARTHILDWPDWEVVYFQPAPSADAAILTARQRLDHHNRFYIVPASHDRLADRSQWTEVAEAGLEAPMHWSPDSNGLFYFAVKDDFWCLWLQRLNPLTRTLAGPPVAVLHLHSGRRMPWNRWLAVTPERVVFALTEVTSNIWSLQLPAGY